MNRVIRMVLRGWDDVSEIVMSACTGAMAAISPSVPLSLLTRPGVGERGAGAEACSTAALQHPTAAQTAVPGPAPACSHWLQVAGAGPEWPVGGASRRRHAAPDCGATVSEERLDCWTQKLLLQLKMSLFIDHCWWSLQSSQKNKKCFLVDIFYDRKSIVLTKSMKLLHCFLLHIKKIRWSAFFINMTFLRLYEKIVPIVMVLSWFILDCHKKNIAAGYFALSSIMSKKKLFHNN